MNSRILPRLSAPAILFALALASTASGQYLEAVISVDGEWVGSMAYNPLMDVVYGASEQPGIFFTIDCATNQVISSIPIRYPLAAIYDSIDHKAYCSYYNNQDSDSILVVDGRTHERIRSIPCDWATELAWDGMRDRLYVSCGPRNVVAVFDCTRDSLICEIPVGSYPLKMYLNGRYRKLYVHNDDDFNLMVIDLWSSTVIDTIDIGTSDEAGYYSPGMDKLYSSSVAGALAIDGAADTVLAQFMLPDEGYAMAFAENADSGLVLVGSDGYPGDYVTALDGRGDTIVGSVRCPRGPNAIQWLPSTRRFLVACTSGDALAILSGGGSEVVSVIDAGDAPFVIAYSPRSERAYVGHLNTHRIYVIRDAVGIAENEGLGASLPRGTVTVVRGVLNLQSTICSLQSAMVLLDVSGRRVLDLSLGPNDVSHLSPGVYFVVTPHPYPLPQGERGPDALKVIIQK